MKYNAICLSAAMLSGCYSSVTVRPATENANGVRYSLPATYLLVTPSANGTATYTWLFLPDTTQQYTVEGDNFLTQFSLDVQTENGLLKQVGQSMDSSGVASKSLSSYAALVAAQTKSKSSSNGNGGAGGESSGPAKSKTSQTSPNDDTAPKITTTQETKTEDKAKKTTTTTTTTAQQTSQKAQKAVNAGGIQKAYGPVLLKVVQLGDSVSLIPVQFPDMGVHGAANEIDLQTRADQHFFETNGSARSLSFRATDAIVNDTVATISSNEAVLEFDKDFPSSGVVGDDVPNASFTAKVTSIEKSPSSSTLAKITFDKTLPKGKFKISFGYRQKKSDAEDLATVTLRVNEAVPP